MEFLNDPYIWFSFSFALFALILWRFGIPALVSILDQRIAQIKKDIETAETLRTEAQSMLTQYRKKQKDAAKEAEKILETAKKNAKQFQKEAEEELAETIKKREQQLVERLHRMEQTAIAEIQAYAAGLAMNAATQIITDKMDTKTSEKLLDASIGTIGRQIH